MRLSESLHRNIIETTVSGILNKFKMKKRRSILFFEDIIANYFKECEKYGYHEKITEIGYKWGVLGVQKLTPKLFTKVPPLVYATVTKKIGKNLNLLSDLKLRIENNDIVLSVKNEFISRIIGKNGFNIGFNSGCLSGFLNREILFNKFIQEGGWSVYHFKSRKHNIHIKGKEKELYNKLNYVPKITGLSLKDVFKKNIFTLKKNNVMEFRGKKTIIIENTIFHLIGSKNLLLERVPFISYRYFNSIVERKSVEKRKLKLLKTLLQVTGWGRVKIIDYDGKIAIKIENPPYGLQAERDNWVFLARVILGYLWTINGSFRINNIESKYKILSIIYSSN